MLVKEGAIALEEHEPAAALEHFQQAEAADPNDAQAVLLQGVALNQLGLYHEAAKQLLRSEQMGTSNPMRDFAIGNALVGTMDFAQAIVRLERYEQEHPGNAATSYLLGRALVGIGEYDEGEAKLNEAIERDALLEPAARAYLSVAAESRGDEAAAQHHLDALMSSPIDNALSRYARREWDLLDSFVTNPTNHCDCCCEDDHWDFFINMGGGYNSNVPLVPDSIAGGGAAGESGFGMLGLGVNRTVLTDDIRRLDVGYRLNLNGYEQPQNFADSGQHYWYVNYVHALSCDLAATLLVDDRYTTLDNRTLNNRVTARPGLLYRISENLRFAAQYEYANDDYDMFFGTALNRDGDNHNGILAAEYYEPCSRTTLQAGYYHMFSDTSGSDFDYDADAAFVSVARVFPWCTTAQVRYVKSFVDFSNPNSFTGFATPRDDDLDLLSVVLTRPVDLALAPYASVYVRFDYFNEDSNVPFYDYDMTVVGGGLTLEY